MGYFQTELKLTYTRINGVPDALINLTVTLAL